MSKYRTMKLFCIAIPLLLCSCATIGTPEWWGLDYTTGADVAVLHMTVKADSKTINEQYRLQNGTAFEFHANTFAGHLPHPDYLYVQWKEVGSGALHQREIDLKAALPSDLDGLQLKLVFEGAEVYLFAAHEDAATVGHPVTRTPAPQYFPDPLSHPYTGNFRPISRSLSNSAGRPSGN